jgi:hypothetical protein
VFDQLDFVYLPSRDVAGEMTYFTAGLGAELVFAIEAFGTRVAMLRLARDGPALLLAAHLDGDQPVFVHRVTDLATTVAALERGGVTEASRFEIPPGPAVELETPGPQRVALYQLTRPETLTRMAGRRDF